MKDSGVSLTDISHRCISSGAGVHPILPLVLAVVLLGACSTSPNGRLQITTPAPVSYLYSEVDMRFQLVTTASITNPCSGVECLINNDFDQQVQQLGARLAQTAYEIYPDLEKRIGSFKFVIAEKDEVGSTSNAAGTIIIYRGVQKNLPDEKTLALLLAREMGHVIGRHHAENAAPRIMLSVIMAVLFPATNMFRATTPTSYIGSKLILASLKPGQLREANTIALKLLEGMGWDEPNVVGTLDSSTRINAVDPWSKPSPSLM